MKKKYKNSAPVLTSMRALGDIFAIPEYSADELREIRTKLTLSQSQFAKLTGYQLRTVQYWESKGRATMPSEAVMRMYQIIEDPKVITDLVTNIKKASRRRGRQLQIHG